MNTFRQPIGTAARLAVLEERVDTNDDVDRDHEHRIRELELRFAKWAGAFAVVAFVGSLVGALVGHHL